MKILLAALNSKFVHTNLALRYIKAVCSDFDITLKEYTINDLDESVLKGIYESGADVVCFSCYIWNIDMTIRLCSSLKKIKPKIITVIGGPEVSFDGVSILERHEFIDFCVCGEGEETSKKLFSFLENGAGSLKSIAGLIYRDGMKVADNGSAPIIENLDSIPFPYYGEEESLKNRIVYYESSRGCPFNCSYCLSSTIKGVRFLSIDRIKRDLKWFTDNDIGLVKFVDRTFNCGKNYFEIWKYLSRNKGSTRFHFEISADLLTKEELDFLNTVSPGLFQFEAGVQSTNTDTLEAINRRADLAKIRKNIERIERGGNIHVHLDLIAGLPDEGYASFGKSFDDVFDMKPQMLQLGFLKLLKGSTLRNEAASRGIKFNDYAPYEVLKTPSLSYKDICALRGIEEMVDRYYNSARFLSSVFYMLRQYNSPFKFFEDLSSYRNGKYIEGYKLSSNDQYRMLYDFYLDMKYENPDFLRECLAFDYLLQGRNPSVPDFLKPKVHVNREYLRKFLQDGSNIEKYLPSHTGEDIRNITSMVYARIFPFDIPSFIKDGRVIQREVTVLFDYSKKCGAEKYAAVYTPLQQAKK